MSRIDKAIELAAKIKSSQQAVPSPEPEVELKQVEVTSHASSGDVVLNNNNPLLAAINEPNGVVAEEFNKLRTLVMYLVNSEPRKNTLLITSAVPGEGKTLIAINLALTIARSSEHPVFLVDADLRRPSIGKVLGIQSDCGFADCLQGDLSLEGAVCRADIGRLTILPAGKKVDDPLKLLSSSRMKEFVRGVKSYNPNAFIIFDSPPVLPFADARLMGAMMDGTIFVIREYYSRLKQVKEGVDSMHDCNLLGMLMNDSSESNDQRYGGYYYGGGEQL